MAPSPLAVPAAVNRGSTARIATALAGHGLKSFIRTPLSAFFALIFPVLLLVIIGAIMGNEIVDPSRGTRLTQYLVAPLSVFGVAQASFAVLAIDTALLRENGILKRLRGTPAPQWTLLASRIAAAVVISLMCVVVLVSLGVAVYGVTILWPRVPAALLTLLFGIFCFAALGLAMVALTRTTLAVQSLANGLLIPLAFISNVFVVGADLPAVLDWIGKVLPLRHFADAFAVTFDPAHVGSPFSPGHLAVMAVWGIAGTAVAWWRFGWEPREGPAPQLAARTAGGAATPALTARRTGRSSAATVVVDQTRYALTGLARDPLSVFFAVIFPVLLLLLFPVIFGDFRVRGLTVAEFMVPAMMTYAMAVTAYVNTPESVAQSRDRAVLKRLRGAPLPAWSYFAGRFAGAALVCVVTAIGLVAVAVLAFDYTLAPVHWAAAVLAFLVSLICFAAVGFGLLALVRSVQSFTAVSLGTLLSLSFLSEVFLIGGELPGFLQAVGDAFPFKHASRALQMALRPEVAASGFAWGHLAALAAWTVVGIVVASRMSWEPHQAMRRT